MKWLFCFSLAFLAVLTTARASYDDEEQSADTDEPVVAADEANRDAEASSNFRDIMGKNAAPPSNIISQQQLQVLLQGKGGTTGSTVAVPLDQFVRTREEIQALAKETSKVRGPAVVLGSTDYRGEAHAGALSLDVTLQVTLGAPGRWKTVPLIGDTAVIVRATSGGRELPLSRDSGYHVWITNQSGEVRVQMQVLIPNRGRRGATEYEFFVAEAPETHFSCVFPIAGLEPRLRAAVRTAVHSAGGRTYLDATLRPTARISLVGFKDLGEASERPAKLYAESLHLMSINEGSIELFSVVRYNILYAGAKSFRIRIPDGWSVESADGEGAFRYSLQDDDGKTVLAGETAFPIRNSYEISLRLRRNLDRSVTKLQADWPKPLDVERSYGWLAIEVPSKHQLDAPTMAQMQAVDVRQLPPEMLDSAVSPIIKAYRFHRDDAALTLAVTRLPEKVPESASIDRIQAESVFSNEGTVLTDLRITMRNRLRHRLRLRLPQGSRVRSTFLDEAPVKPSLDSDGAVMLPLKRSAGGTQLRPFVLHVVVEQAGAPFGLWGRPTLALPAVDLPTSSLSWTVHVPARNTYSGLAGDLRPQNLAGSGEWHQAAFAPNAGVDNEAIQEDAVARDRTLEPSAEGGAMPVRIGLPKNGVRLRYQRYWLDANKASEVHFYYVRSWLLRPVALALLLLLTLGVAFVLEAAHPRMHLPLRGRAALALGLVSILASAWPLVMIDHLWAALFASGVGAIAWLGVGHAWQLLQQTGRKLRELFQQEWAGRQQARAGEAKTKFSFARFVWHTSLGGTVLLIAVLLLLATVELLSLLGNPLQ